MFPLRELLEFEAGTLSISIFTYNVLRVKSGAAACVMFVASTVASVEFITASTLVAKSLALSANFVGLLMFIGILAITCGLAWCIFILTD